MNPLAATNPFTVLTLIAAPAVLTNAASVLALGTSNRFARAIDRARVLSGELEKADAETDPLTPMRVRQLNRSERRAQILLQALRAFYLALGNFATAALVSLIGASLATSAHHLIFRVALILALITGVIGVGSLVVGCFMLVHETRLALLNVTEEARVVRARFADYLEQTPPGDEPG
jgi:hypothetical protein